MATIYTVGHGARSAEELVRLLNEAQIAELVDVRAYPGSRRHPQFSRENLRKSLEQAGIRYAWEGKALEGACASCARKAIRPTAIARTSPTGLRRGGTG